MEKTQTQANDTSQQVLDLLANFPLVGIAPRDHFTTDHPILADMHPDKVLKGFQSVIVFGEGKHKKPELNRVPETFQDHLALLTTPLQVVNSWKAKATRQPSSTRATWMCPWWTWPSKQALGN